MPRSIKNIDNVMPNLTRTTKTFTIVMPTDKVISQIWCNKQPKLGLRHCASFDKCVLLISVILSKW